MPEYEIERNARVVATDGEVGRVSHVVVDPKTREVTEIVVVHRGREVVIPIAAVAATNGDGIMLRVARSALRGADGFAPDELRGTDYEDARNESQRRASHGGAAGIDASDDTVVLDGLATASSVPEMREEGELRIPVVKERVQFETRLVDFGYIEIRKTVITEQVMVPVELRREIVEIRRVEAEDGVVSVADAPGAFEGSTLRIPVFRERAVIQKEVVVSSEVILDRTQVFEYVEVVESVRRERVTVDDDGVQSR